MGDLIREHTKNLNLEFNDENIGKVAHSEREKFGFGIWATRTLERLNELNLSERELVIIDGIRGDTELAVFSEAFGDEFLTVGVIMSTEQRFELLKKRGREDAPMTRAEFDTRDVREAIWGIEKALEQADYLLINTGTLPELKELFNELLKIIQTNAI